MATQQEPDFPPGHPARFDYKPGSPEAKEWARLNVHLKGERDFPVGHTKALDTPGNTNHVQWVAGSDPAHPELEQFSGRTPEQAEGARLLYQMKAAEVTESPVTQPIEAPQPPPPGDVSLPTGQPGGK